MQVGQQIRDVLRAELLAITGHFVAAHPDDVGDPLVVGRQTAEGKILAPEDSLEPGAFLAARGIGFVAAVALGSIDPAARGLLRIQTELGVRLAAFDGAGEGCSQDQENRKNPGKAKASRVEPRV